MKFNSQVCTNIYQSERLLKLGLDKETADMFHLRVVGHAEDEFDVNNFAECTQSIYDIHSYPSEDTIPAWSLSKLISLMPEYIHFDALEDTKYYLTVRPHCLLKISYKQDRGHWLYGSESSNLFDAIIDVIEYLILGKHFDTQYLN
jgi:hypothetical protein